MPAGTLSCERRAHIPSGWVEMDVEVSRQGPKLPNGRFGASAARVAIGAVGKPCVPWHSTAACVPCQRLSIRQQPFVPGQCRAAPCRATNRQRPAAAARRGRGQPCL
jgi:hypothetical protein